jgi:hypothetical protein
VRSRGKKKKRKKMEEKEAKELIRGILFLFSEKKKQTSDKGVASFCHNKHDKYSNKQK